MNFLKRIWNALFGGIEEPDPWEPRLKWSIKPRGMLLLEGRDQTPLHPRSLVNLERHYKAMLELIEKSGYPIEIEALAIETHIAAELWNEGSLRREHLEAGFTSLRYIEIKLPILGEDRVVRIVTNSYFEDYEFIVSGHPQGYVRVRDNPDLLAVMAAEPHFMDPEPTAA